MQRCDWLRQLSSLESRPIFEQSVLMQFRPRLDHALLAARQLAADQINRIDGINRNSLAIVIMKVRRVMLRAGFHEHSNDDSEKSA